MPALGGCVGHNCRIGSGHIIYPARIIESDVVLFAKPAPNVITKTVTYANSDHHKYPNGTGHVARYHNDVSLKEEYQEDTASSNEVGPEPTE